MDEKIDKHPHLRLLPAPSKLEPIQRRPYDDAARKNFASQLEPVAVTPKITTGSLLLMIALGAIAIAIAYSMASS